MDYVESVLTVAFVCSFYETNHLARRSCTIRITANFTLTPSIRLTTSSKLRSSVPRIILISIILGRPRSTRRPWRNWSSWSNGKYTTFIYIKYSVLSFTNGSFCLYFLLDFGHIFNLLETVQTGLKTRWKCLKIILKGLTFVFELFLKS